MGLPGQAAGRRPLRADHGPSAASAGAAEGASVVVRRGTDWEVVPLEEIVYCEVQGRKLYLHKRDGTVVDYYARLEELEHRVDGRFFKCHRSYLVNLDYVRGFRAGRAALPGGRPCRAGNLFPSPGCGSGT